MSTELEIVLGLWVGCFLFEAFDGFRTTRQLLREMGRQQRWFWGRVARPFGRLLATREAR